MVKKSPAKLKMLAAQAKRAAAEKRETKTRELQSLTSNTDSEIERYNALDQFWREIGLATSARRALIDDGLYELADLRKVSLAALKELHGMGPNAIRVLVAEMKKSDLSFRK